MRGSRRNRGRSGILYVESRGLYAMCTTPPPVRDWISETLAHVFRAVPDLGGVFSITMSENLTNCHSHFHAETCPRCSKRRNWEVVGEVMEAIHRGVRRSNPRAEVIIWDWGWPEEMSRELIPRLPKDTRQLSASEWSTPIERGGVKTQVDGPGPTGWHMTITLCSGQGHAPRCSRCSAGGTYRRLKRISTCPTPPCGSRHHRWRWRLLPRCCRFD